MKFLLPIPSEKLQAEGGKRQKWLNIEHSPDIRREIYIPLHQKTIPIDVFAEYPDKPIGIPVAVYRFRAVRGHYDEYIYCGDSTK